MKLTLTLEEAEFIYRAVVGSLALVPLDKREGVTKVCDHICDKLRAAYDMQHLCDSAANDIHTEGGTYER